MAIKRKFELECDDARASITKQPRLVPFPQSKLDADVDMMDAEVLDLKPLIIPPQPFHSRLPSNASSSTPDSPDASPSYPTFNLYPHDQDYMDFAPTNASEDKSVGLLQPRGPTFTHHGQNCTQIPKLRIACSPGLSGSRTMWAHCEECGAIEMVDSD
ncbi:hypothetical protein OBBRIDRAFT_243259 [Obba rivulosa]|uniref:Uncharacterized protein n=1 Tax=Obba rivulosa TaxID=1052685 RepID=A0A8E2DGW8_9APHY|nr:hypothetical protein OBBRIDRAFT_243259 [Obba rivulosa]